MWMKRQQKKRGRYRLRFHRREISRGKGCFSRAQGLKSRGQAEAGCNSPREKSPQNKSRAKVVIKRRGVDALHGGSPIGCDKIFFIVLLVGLDVKNFFKKGVPALGESPKRPRGALMPSLFPVRTQRLSRSGRPPPPAWLRPGAARLRPRSSPRLPGREGRAGRAAGQ